jgi:hypothetical protein
MHSFLNTPNSQKKTQKKHKRLPPNKRGKNNNPSNNNSTNLTNYFYNFFQKFNPTSHSRRKNIYNSSRSDHFYDIRIESNIFF